MKEGTCGITSSPKGQKRSKRSKAEIERDLVAAITDIVVQRGFTQLAINNVSEQAHVTKRVIYENYGTFENLLRVYFVKHDFWTDLVLSKIAGECSDAKDFFVAVLKEFYRTFDENPIFQCIVRWEIAAPNDFVRKGAKNRESSCREMLEKNKDFFQPLGVDIEALYAVLISGIYYLVLRKDVSTFCNIDFSTKAGKERMSCLIDKLAEFLFAGLEVAEGKKRSAVRLLSRGIPPREVAEILEMDEGFMNALAQEH